MTAFDDLSLLRAFVCIVECGSISAGARHFKIPQPTLSRYLRVLEEALRYGALAARYPSDESDADGTAFAGGRTGPCWLTPKRRTSACAKIKRY